MPPSKYIQGLNPQQKSAVFVKNGPLLIMAGAGSGKTRVLTHRIVYLIKQEQVPAGQILAITFTNKAANEMKERLKKIIANPAISSQIWVSTFHSFCLYVLKDFGDQIGVKKTFTLTSPDDQKTVAGHAIKNMTEDPNEKRRMEENLIDKFELLNYISGQKNELKVPMTNQQINQVLDKADRSDSRTMNFINKFRFLERGYRLYQQELERNISLDFDDLIFKTAELFQQRQNVLNIYQERFRYINVDEYQDTNHAQYVLVNLMAKKYQNLAVVGDADQSIYGWRGADIRNILNFKQDYPTAKIIKLEQNYRSTPQILKAANDIIKNNEEREEKQLWTAKSTGKDVDYTDYADADEEAEQIVEDIQKQHQENELPYESFAVLYRYNALSRLLEKELTMKKIPYQIVGSLSFFDREEIKDLIAYLKLVLNPRDNLSFSRIINKPRRGVGQKSMEQLNQLANEKKLSLVQTIANFDLNRSISSTKAVQALKDFVDNLKKWHKLAETISSAALLGQILLDTEYKLYLDSLNAETVDDRLENINELLLLSQNFDEEYNRKNAINTDIHDRFTGETTYDDPTLDRLNNLLVEISPIKAVSKGDNNGVVLTSIHSAKGLEFPIVYLIGLEEGVLPSNRSIRAENTSNNKLLEEERRLTYVAITRAQKQLHLSSVVSRYSFGNSHENPRSRFLDEMQGDYQEIKLEHGIF